MVDYNSDYGIRTRTRKVDRIEVNNQYNSSEISGRTLKDSMKRSSRRIDKNSCDRVKTKN